MSESRVRGTYDIDLDEAQSLFCCPILLTTYSAKNPPVILKADGTILSKKAADDWFSQHQTHPITAGPISSVKYRFSLNLLNIAETFNQQINPLLKSLPALQNQVAKQKRELERLQALQKQAAEQKRELERLRALQKQAAEQKRELEHLRALQKQAAGQKRNLEGLHALHASKEQANSSKSSTEAQPKGVPPNKKAKLSRPAAPVPANKPRRVPMTFFKAAARVSAGSIVGLNRKLTPHSG